MEKAVMPTFWIMQTTNPFSSILYDSTVSSSFRILPGLGQRKSCTARKLQHVVGAEPRSHTRVDKLLLLGIPSLLL